MQDNHLYFIKSSLTLSYSRKQLQSLHLSLWIPSVILSTRFDNELNINLALSINLNFIRSGCYIFFTSFINFCNFFFYLSSIFPRTFKLSLINLMIHLPILFWHNNKHSLTRCEIVYFKLHMLCAAPMHLPV